MASTHAGKEEIEADTVQRSTPENIDSQPTAVKKKWTWCGMLGRHWIGIYLFCSVLVHAGCIAVLQYGSPQTAVSSVMQINVLAMCAAVFLESHLYRRGRLAADGFFDDGDYDIRPTEEEARKELAFIAVFSTRRWRVVLRGIGYVGGAMFKYCTYLLVLCSLLNVAVVLVPRQYMPVEVAQYAQLSLGIISVLDIVATLMVVLNWVYFRYETARSRVSTLLLAR